MPKPDTAAAATEASAADPSNKQCTPASMLAKLQLGAVVQVSSVDGSLKYLTRLIGVDGSKVLITALPTPKQMKKETVDVVYDNVFFPDKSLVMRLIAQGSIFAFKSEVIAVNYSGSKLLLSSFPSKIQNQALRRDARLPCALSASCLYDEQTFNAVVIDISRGGCQLHFDPSLLSNPAEEMKDQSLVLSLRFNPESELEEINTKIISSTKVDSNTVALGLAFLETEASVKHYLDSLQLGEMSAMFL